MSRDEKDKITNNLFGIEPILINSSLLVAQQRKRLYWVGALQKDGSYKKIEIKQPKDKGILLKDILESGNCWQEKSYSLTASYNGAIFYNTLEKKQRTIIAEPIKIGQLNKGGQGDRIYSIQGKSVCLSANGGGRGAKTGLYKIDLPNGDYDIRKLTPIECERLQGFPDNYSKGISNTQRYKALGNSFTVPVIKHILQNLFLEV
jgi:DNA (cytosine-5)-methyltransferase 3A